MLIKCSLDIGLIFNLFIFSPNQYDYWNEQRANLNKEVISATQQLLGKVQMTMGHDPMTSSGPWTGGGTGGDVKSLATLFLQLTVDDLGICLPIASGSGVPGMSSTLGSKFNYDSELKSALVVTLESTRISACSCGSLVSKAKFTGLCFRFADDFETSLDDWKPDPSDPTTRNLCIVSEGTYEICSRTRSGGGATGATGSGVPGPSAEAKWFLNVSWKMEGFDIHVDTSIGKQMSNLFKTLTALAGDELDEMDTVEYGSSMDAEGGDDKDGASVGSPAISGVRSDVGDGVDIVGRQEGMPPPGQRARLATLNEDSSQVAGGQRRGSLAKTSAAAGASSVDTKRRSRAIESELNEQAKVINDLRQLGASAHTIEVEIKRLHELEAAIFNDFRREVVKKLRRQSVKTSSKPRPAFSRMNTMVTSPTSSALGLGHAGTREGESPVFGRTTTPLEAIESLDSELDMTDLSPGAIDFGGQAFGVPFPGPPPPAARSQGGQLHKYDSSPISIARPVSSSASGQKGAQSSGSGGSEASLLRWFVRSPNESSPDTPPPPSSSVPDLTAERKSSSSFSEPSSPTALAAASRAAPQLTATSVPSPYVLPPCFYLPLSI